MATKVQTQLLVSPLTRQRADALSVVLGEPRAEIYRMALVGAGLPGMERRHSGLLSELGAMGMRLMPTDTDLEFAERVAKDGFTMADLRAMDTYPGP